MKKFLLFFLLVVAAPAFGQSDRDLYELCKVWGFMKYHHPAVMSGEYDMDRELFEMLDKLKAVEKEKNSKQRNEMLSQWVAKFGHVTMEEKHIIDDSANFRQVPDYRWIDKKVFGKKLAQQLTDVKNAIRPDTSYYVGYKGQYNNHFFRNEKSYDVDFTESKYAVLGLFRFWNAIECFFPYKYLNDRNWDSVLEELIPRFVAVDNRGDYLDKLHKLTAYVNDSHVSIHGSDNPYLATLCFKMLQKMMYNEQVPVTTVYSNGKLIVTGYQENYGKECGLEPGDVVLEIDGVDIDSLFRLRSKYFGFSNWESGCEFKLKQSLLAAIKDTLLVKCLRNGQEIIAKTTPLIFRATSKKEDSLMKQVGDNYIYANIPVLDSISIHKVFEQPSNGLILDLRKYPGDGGIMDCVNAHIQAKPTPFARFSYPNVVNPGYFEIKTYTFAGKDNSNYYKNPIVVLVGGNTISHAEFFTMSCQGADNVTVIGSQTAGADGDIGILPLPGCLLIVFSGLGVYYPDGGETQRVGVRIDEIVYPTPEGIREGRDELVERAVEIIDVARKTSRRIPE